MNPFPPGTLSCLSPQLPPASLPPPLKPLSRPQLCANLDTWRIMSPERYQSQLQQHIQQPCKQYDLCHRRSQVHAGQDMG